MKTIKSSQQFVISESIPWENIGPGIQRQILGYDDQIMMVKIKFAKGGIGELHHHPHVQASYIESGSFEFTIGDEKKVLNQGDAYYIPPDVTHGCICLEAGVLIDAFSPVREDFLK